MFTFSEQKQHTHDHMEFLFLIVVSWGHFFFGPYFIKERKTEHQNCERSPGLWRLPHQVPVGVSMENSLKWSLLRFLVYQTRILAQAVTA